MQIPVYHVNALTDGLRGGNPAALCRLERWSPVVRTRIDGRSADLPVRP